MIYEIASSYSPRIILASGSPRRRGLLKQLQVNFVVKESTVSETLPKRLFTATPQTKAIYLAQKKAKAVQKQFPREIILGADTLVTLRGKIFGKPTSSQEALEMLLALRGKMHTVTTGIALLHRNKTLTSSSTTKVWFENVSLRFLEEYVESSEPMDKAGAYGIQGRGALLVKRIDGDYFNVVGLPLVKVWKLFTQLKLQE